MDGGSCHCTGDRDQDHPHGKEMQKSKLAVWRGPTNSCEKKRSEKGEKERYKHGYILSPCLFNLYAEYIMRNAEL